MKRSKKYISKSVKLNLTTFIFNEIGHFQSDKMSIKQIQGNCFFCLKKSAKQLTLIDYNTKCCSECNSTA